MAVRVCITIFKRLRVFAFEWNRCVCPLCYTLRRDKTCASHHLCPALHTRVAHRRRPGTTERRNENGGRRTGGRERREKEKMEMPTPWVLSLCLHQASTPLQPHLKYPPGSPPCHLPPFPQNLAKPCPHFPRKEIGQEQKH